MHPDSQMATYSGAVCSVGRRLRSRTDNRIVGVNTETARRESGQRKQCSSEPHRKTSWRVKRTCTNSFSKILSSDCTGRLRINKCSSVAENISTDYRNRSNEIKERKINPTFSFTLKCNFDVMAQLYYLRVQLKNMRGIHKSQVGFDQNRKK